MHAARSLRIRLFILIICPLIVIACLLGVWRYTAAKTTADDVFDRALLSVALAVSRDITVSGGDALSPTTRDLISDAAGGEVFYHATGPAGIYIAGYSYPPITQGRGRGQAINAPSYFEAVYRNSPVRVLKLTERSTVDGLTGNATVTVWQRNSDREALATDLALRAVALIGVLLITLALVVWFGVQRGLRPLMRLEDAISARSPDDLSTIKRPVPTEALGIVATLNRLFEQLQSSIDAQQVFISEAAHQLRNPAAAVQSMAEAARDAPDGPERQRRLDEVVDASRDAARVAEQLLSLERVRLGTDERRLQDCDLNEICKRASESAGVSVLASDVGFELQLYAKPLVVCIDPLFVGEAIKNLIDNALKHGGLDLSYITVSTTLSGAMASVTVADDGEGLSPKDRAAAFGRFTQVSPGSGSGLGLSIAQSVAERHSGSLVINDSEKGASLTLSFPLVS